MVEQSSDVHIEGTDAKTVVGRRSPVPAVVDTGTRLADALADVMGVDSVAADAHFFDGLGANSLVMAQFCARVRKREDLPSPSMKDIYRYPTISALAAALAESAPTPAGSPDALSSTAVVSPPEPVTRASTLAHTLAARPSC